MKEYDIDEVVRDLRRTSYTNDAVRQVILWIIILSSIAASWYFVYLVASAVVAICK
jgi:hypothetical protein